MQSAPIMLVIKEMLLIPNQNHLKTITEINVFDLKAAAAAVSAAAVAAVVMHAPQKNKSSFRTPTNMLTTKQF